MIDKIPTNSDAQFNPTRISVVAASIASQKTIGSHTLFAYCETLANITIPASTKIDPFASSELLFIVSVLLVCIH